jgi:predicted Zn-dependent peptidase
VILEEMSMYLDDPDDSLNDEFDSVVFGNHPLGMNILGTEKTVKSFKRKDFRQFVKEHLDTRRVVFTSVGNISMTKAIKIAQRYLEKIPRVISRKKRKLFEGYKPREVVMKRDIKQARVALGRASYKLGDDRRAPFYMLTNILGGNGLNSRLNLALRERRGYVYSVGAQYVPYTDVGMFAIQFGTEPSQMKKSLELVNLELRKLRDDKMGVKQLAAAKEQIMGNIAMSEENNLNFMMTVARSVLDQGAITPLDEIFETIRNTSGQKLQQLANEMFIDEKMSFLLMEPRKN